MSTRKEEHVAVAAFTVHMLNKLRSNAHKGHWADDSLDELVERVQEELDELVAEIKRPRKNKLSMTRLKKIISEAADVANMAMMIADNCEESLRDLGDPT
jgi:NTP pyrophosphatase (non-canonical NTP hydrolase)